MNSLDLGVQCVTGDQVSVCLHFYLFVCLCILSSMLFAS